MATVTYTLSGSSVIFEFTPTDITTFEPDYFIEYTSGTLTGITEVTQGGQPPLETTISGLTVGQTYTFTWKWQYQGGTPVPLVIEQGTVTVVVPDDTPKLATQDQWEDLASRIKAKADSSDVPTITMTATDPGEGSALAANNYIAVYGGDPIIMDYSTSEINTGAKWIDGSTIYKKTINFGAFPNATAKSVSHSISNLGWVVKTEIIGYDSSQGVYFPISYVDSNVLANSIAYFVSTSEVTVRAGADRSSITQSYITLYYTKSSS